MFAGLYLGRVPAGKIVVHLPGGIKGLLAQFGRQVHQFAPVRFGVKQGTLRNFADEHLLKGHCLGAELQAVGVVLFGRAVLVFHRQGQPKPLLPLQRDPLRIGAKFHDVTDAGQPQPVADDPHAAHRQQVAALFPQGFIMAAFMQQVALGGAQVLGPLLFQISECPLPAAERKMLNAGHLQIVVRIRHRLPLPGSAGCRR